MDFISFADRTSTDFRISMDFAEFADLPGFREFPRIRWIFTDSHVRIDFCTGSQNSRGFDNLMDFMGFAGLADFPI